MTKRKRPGCSGKRKHVTFEAAHIALKKMAHGKKQSGNPMVTVMRVYACGCGNFHVGRTKEIDWAKVPKAGQI